MAEHGFTLTITCRRPRSRAVDDFHVQPERVVRTVAALVGTGAEVTLTPRTVRLCVTNLRHVPDLEFWRRRMASLLDGLWLDVPRVRGVCQLPAPARIEIREAELASEEPAA